MKDPVVELIEAAQEVLRGSADHTRLHTAVAAVLQKQVRRPRQQADELLQVRHAWHFPPSRSS